MGVGAMIVGGVWSILGVSRGIWKGIQGAVAAYREPEQASGIERTERDLNIGWIVLLLAPVVVAVLMLCTHLTGSLMVGLIVLDQILRGAGSNFRTYVMPVAVGIYLPWALSVPIFFGGIAAWLTGQIAGRGRERSAIHRGVLIGSGLIAGEALMGIVIALLIFSKIEIPQAELSRLLDCLLYTSDAADE